MIFTTQATQNAGSSDKVLRHVLKWQRCLGPVKPIGRLRFRQIYLEVARPEGAVRKASSASRRTTASALGASAALAISIRVTGNASGTDHDIIRSCLTRCQADSEAVRQVVRAMSWLNTALKWAARLLGEIFWLLVVMARFLVSIRMLLSLLVSRLARLVSMRFAVSIPIVGLIISILMLTVAIARLVVSRLMLAIAVARLVISILGLGVSIPIVRLVVSRLMLIMAIARVVSGLVLPMASAIVSIRSLVFPFVRIYRV